LATGDHFMQTNILEIYMSEIGLINLAAIHYKSKNITTHTIDSYRLTSKKE
jgi:hypothetical protein